MIKIICGLGNPGRKYKHTRHNVGFDVIETLKKRMDISGNGSARRFEYWEADSVRGNIVLMKPTTFVNRSGWAADDALAMFGVEPSEFFVIVDDFNLPLGRIRIRKSGSAGGHNGLISIIDELGTPDFPRLRAGIGPLPEAYAQAPESIPDFVLGLFSPEEREIVDSMIKLTVVAVDEIIGNGLDSAISKFNNSSANPTPEG